VFTFYFRLITQFTNNLEVIYLPVYYPNNDEKADATLYANNVRKVNFKIK
jgi:hypothetical protein